jgi:hypothetical protein
LAEAIIFCHGDDIQKQYDCCLKIFYVTRLALFAIICITYHALKTYEEHSDRNTSHEWVKFDMNKKGCAKCFIS